MPLLDSQIREILKAPKQKDVIQRAVQHEQRLRFHTEVALDRSRTSPYTNDFLNSVQGLLQPDKYRTFLSLFRFPVKTVQDTDKIFDSLAKVFDGQNPVYKYDFADAEYLDDWQEFSKDDQNRWRTEGMDAMRLNINSIVICDMPPEQVTPMPEPYFYFLDVSHVIEFDSDGMGFDWIIFRRSPTEIVVIDDKSYRIFQTKEKLNEIKKLISEAPHDLTYCPAHWFWAQSISKNDPCVKLSPISTHIQELDWLLSFFIFKRIADLSGAFPITWSYDYECDYKYENEQSGVFYACDHGFLRDQQNRWIHLQDGALMPCPACSNKKLTGPGSYIKVPVPEKDGVDMREPAGEIARDVLTLEYIVAEIERLQKHLYEDITGYGGEPTNDQAVNEKQIIAAFESRTSILRDIKKNLEIIRQWTDFTRCKLRYADKFNGCSINMGTDFYLYDANLIMSLYTLGQKEEWDDSILDMLEDQYYATKYRNNQDQLARYTILKNIKPARHVTKSKATALYQGKIISLEDLIIILKFSTFVTRFEREQASLLDFGRNLDFDTRIKRIQTIIYSYAGESIRTGKYIETVQPATTTADPAAAAAG